MSGTPETAWEAAGVVWRTDEHAPVRLNEHLGERVRRQSGRLRLILAGEIVTTVAILVVSGALIMRNAGANAVRVGALVLLYTAGVWAFTLWNRRGIWSPYGETTADFVGLLRVRAQRRIRTAWFCIIVIGLAAILSSREIKVAWQAGDISLTDWIWIGFTAYSACFIVWSAWCLWHAQREIRELDALARDLEAQTNVPR
ncbi:MAG: hypothetical protein ACT4P6_06820 [Gemmatimonadaceae bacterium]